MMSTLLYKQSSADVLQGRTSFSYLTLYSGMMNKESVPLKKLGTKLTMENIIKKNLNKFFCVKYFANQNILQKQGTIVVNSAV